MKKPSKRIVLLFVVLVLFVLIPFGLWGSAVDTWFEAQMETAGEHKLRTAAILFALLGSDIVMPIPSSLASTVCGRALGFGWGFLVSFMAMNLSACLGWLLGRFFSNCATRKIGERDMRTLAAFDARNGVWLLVALRPVPVLAEASVLFSGIVKHHPAKAAAALVVSNAVVSVVYAAIGAWGKTVDSMIPAFLATVAVSGVLMLAAKRKHATPRATV